MNENLLTVSELNERIKSLIDSDPVLMQVAVAGELSNYKVYPSGHHYFTLKDQQSSVRCVMFRSSASKLRFKPESGMGVTAVGRVSVYPRDGAYQLYCTELIPQGVGDLQLAFEQLKARLMAEGLFDRAHKKPIPRFPKRIAVITSGAGAAVRDIIRVLGARWPMAEVVVLPVRVQGAEAPPEIVGAIKYANRWKVGDLIITGRGGGSMEDLWAFNDERVARAIYESEIPVISAVGHEPDVTIADFVADLRAATPSNAAELAVPDGSDMAEQLAAADARMLAAANKRLRYLRGALDQLAGRRVLTEPGSYLDTKRLELDRAADRLAMAAERTVSAKKHVFLALAASLEAMSPLKVLSRGFSVATAADGSVVRSADQLREGDRIKLRLADGGAEAEITSAWKG
ncbi:MAG TPA: exodeoxyribonuclease VII large subunit [Firmicutes bacterium]|nr:exodeoxyribonuclease VII large subunit [Bacillota bacterium]